MCVFQTMKLRTLVIIAAVLYAAIFAAFVVGYLSTKDPQAIAFLSMGVSSALMLLTLIFGILVLRDSPSEKYKEMYMQDGEGEEKKE